MSEEIKRTSGLLEFSIRVTVEDIDTLQDLAEFAISELSMTHKQDNNSLYERAKRVHEMIVNFKRKSPTPL